MSSGIYPDLSVRPSRSPNYEAENRALEVLAAELAGNPRNVLQKLVEIALACCHADSAGISLLESQDGQKMFRWDAIGGLFAYARNRSIPYDGSPCKVCIENNATTLMYLPHRRFPIVPSEPPFVEVLLVPFHCQEKAVGTVWVIMHQFERQFESGRRASDSKIGIVRFGWMAALARTHRTGRARDGTYRCAFRDERRITDGD